MFVCPECGGPQPAGGACPLDGTPMQPVGEDVMLGTTIGAYRVANLLGIGGMGRVYKGVHPTIGSRVAIKVLSRECTDRKDLVERFFAEAKAVNLIRHESIVNVLDLSVLPDGRPYIIMEYLDGAPLGAIVAHAQAYRTPLPIGGLARLAVEVLDALGAAHSKGIVHRDLKPDNIFVTPSGRPKVLDFGIARFTDPGSGGGSTRTGSLLGTPHYMSPEQAAGRAVDHRADLYAIGVILFECVTGRKPFAAESLFDLLRKHVEEPPPAPRAWRPDLGESFEQVILCALQKAPDQRFASAQAMSMALQHATAQLPQDQWTPITGSGKHRSPSTGGWTPSAPSNWGGSRASPRPSEQPIQQIERLQNQSTVSASAGQLQKQPPAPKPRSKAGIWIALGLVALVGTGVAIAVVNNGDSESSPEQVAENSPPPPPGDGTAAEPDKRDRTDLEKQLAEATKDLPEDMRKQVEAATRDAQAKIEELEKGRPAVKPGDSAPPKKPVVEKADADADAVADADAAKPAGDPLANVPAVSPPGGWNWDTKTITPGGWNPKRVNVQQFIGFAMGQAKKHVPDAQLTRIGVTGVSPDGFANLELPTLASDTGDIELRFISPSRSKPDPSQPQGLPVKLVCEFRIEGGPDGVVIRSMFASNCKERGIPVPRCTALALWKLALANKAPTNAVANISYYQASMHKTGRFFFDIGFGHDVSFSKVFTDADCP